jgi:uncharacterized protein YndB with AHSA1/START domain
MSKPEFVYVIYIRASLEQVWAGLTEPEFTRKYWMGDNVSDWQVGSRWEHKQGGENIVTVGEVVESDRPNRLVLTWVPPNDEGKPEKTSRVCFELNSQDDWPGGPWTQLSIAHTELEPDSDMLKSISWGWPALMSGLKTLLEGGL